MPCHSSSSYCSFRWNGRGWSGAYRTEMSYHFTHFIHFECQLEMAFDCRQVVYGALWVMQLRFLGGGFFDDLDLAITWGQGWTLSRFADFTREFQHFINQPPGQYNSVTRSNNCNDNTNCMHLLPFSLDRHQSHSMVMRWRMLDDDENDVHAVDGAASKMFHVWCWKWWKWRKWKMVNDAQW